MSLKIRLKKKIGKGEKLILSFLKLFGGGENDWGIGQIWNAGRQRITRALSPPASPAAEPDISEEDTTDDEGRSITTRKRRSASQQEQGPSNASNGSPGPSKMGRKRTRSD